LQKFYKEEYSQIEYMEVFECITTRRSVRKYLDVPVEWEKVGTVLEAGRAAPSAGNLQNWKFIVVLDKDLRHQIADAALQQSWMKDAPVHIIVCAEPKKAEQFYGLRGERLYTVQNCAAAIENMLLTAHSLNLGSCWVGAFDEEMLKRTLNIPDDVRPQAIITLGYPAEKTRAPVRYRIEDIVFLETWMNRIKDINAYFGYTSAKVQKAISKSKEFFNKLGEIAKKKVKKD
jgi:nitroreductase